jgi:transposase
MADDGEYTGPGAPAELSPGRVQGSITKAGNTRARRLLIEAAWHHRRDCHNPGAAMRSRWKLASPAAKTRGHTGCTSGGRPSSPARRSPSLPTL